MASEILVEKNVMVPMRDGVALATDVYRPAGGEPLPAIVQRTPYDKEGVALRNYAFEVMRAVQAGYACVVQDTRGRYQSQGEFHPFLDDGVDGADTIAWVAAQPWCDGAVGMAGGSRTSAPDYLAASLEWYGAINRIISRYQIDRGGPVILYQIENEYSSGVHDVAYMQALEAKARADGITVPLFFNDSYPGGNWRPGTPGGVDVYGFDSYPQGFNASNPTHWSAVPDFTYVRNVGAQLNPLFLAEGQGGSFDPWGGPGFVACRELTDANFNRVFYKNNIAAGLTMQNFYMLFGGTSWGWLPSEDLYSSYDYGAAITEGRQLTDKYSEDKKIGYFVAAVTPIDQTSQLPDVTSSNTAIRVRAMENPATGTMFLTILHKDSTSTNSDNLTFPLSINDGNYTTIPQQGTIAINGRDAKLLVAAYRMERQRLVYSTSEIMTHANFGARDFALFYGRTGEGGETVLRRTGQPQVEVLAGTVSSSYAGGDLRLNYVHQGLALVLIQGGGAPLLLAIGDDAAAATFWRLDVAGAPVIVRGPALLRSAAFSGSSIVLTGDTAAATLIEVFAQQPGARAIRWNGRAIAVTPTVYGSLQGQLAGPVAYTPPALGGWRTRYETPEREPGFDDQGWVVAANTSTNNPTKPPAGQIVLYSDDYGFHHGDTWYRGRFTADGSETAITLSATTGRPGSFLAWLNGVFIGDVQVGTGSPSGSATFDFPAGALKSGAENVLAVVVENLGHQEDFSSNDSHKQPRGITSYALVGSAASLAWRIQGTLGGEHPVDTVRGPYNNGGLFGERAGWYLPGYPDQGWQAVSLPASQPTPGIAWYRTTVTLAVPAGQDVSFALQITDSAQRDYRARIFVNGWHMGIYINTVGPQTQYVVPNGILDPRGDNTIAVAVWSGAAGSGGLGAIALVVLGQVAGGVDVPAVVSPAYNPSIYIK